MDNQRCTLKRKRSVNESSPAPENFLDGQTVPETDPFIEYGRATQEEEDPDASDFEESIDKPEEILLTYQTILNINENKFIFGTLPESPIPPLSSTSRPSSYVPKIAPESSKPSETLTLLYIFLFLHNLPTRCLIHSRGSLPHQNHCLQIGRQAGAP